MVARVSVIVIALVVGLPPLSARRQPAAARDTLVLIALDGVRAAEMFGGLDAGILRSTLAKDARLEDSPAFKAGLSTAVTITGVGSLIGLLLGVGSAFGATAIMRKFTQAPVHAWLSPSTVLVAVVASVIVGLAFGIYPALRAARLSPIDAIHHE